ncbi:MAG: response regulator transcription factor [Bacillota bacterium]
MENKIRVIIAEDMDIIRENYIEELQKDSMIEIVGASASGSGAVELFKQHGADIVLMDVEMESQTAGIVSASKICEMSADVKVIFLSVREDDQTIIASLSTGAVDYLVKTNDYEKIIAHIKKAYFDKVEMELGIQRCMRDEFWRLTKSNHEILLFTKKIATLTQAEREIIGCLLENMKLKDIAKSRFVELVTIKTQIGQLLRKFGATRSKEIVSKIRELKIEELFI